MMRTYKRPLIVLERGNGCYLYDKRGKAYLDMIGGIATAPLGHNYPEISVAIAGQAKKLINASNLFYTEEQAVLAQKLAKISGMGRCFFSNSGAESVEAAIKLACRHTKKFEIIAAKGAFHGRTIGALSATWKKKFRKPFKPLLDKFRHIDYNNAALIKKSITKKTAAVIIEPIQGENGVIVPDYGYLTELREICDRKNVLLILDEIQTGTGRTGKFFAYQHEKIKPDIIASAKGLASGIPVGVTIAREGIDFGKGEHGSTFGGNSLACAAASKTIEVILKKNLMKNASAIGSYFMKKLKELKTDHSAVEEVRGKGLMIGLELKTKCDQIAEYGLKKGVLLNAVNEKTLRFLPALIVGKKEIDFTINVLNEALSK